jgi:hypothetical protein
MIDKKKVNPVCEVCTGWLEIVYVEGKPWLKCRICGMMKKPDQTERSKL